VLVAQSAPGAFCAQIIPPPTSTVRGRKPHGSCSGGSPTGHTGGRSVRGRPTVPGWGQSSASAARRR